MDECFKCGISANRARLFDVISSEGIVKVCEQCSLGEHMPIIRRPTTFQLKESERRQSFSEKASQFSGIKNVEEEQLKQKQETTLRDIVNKNFEMSVQEKPKPRPDLIDNFHWVIMRARRFKKLTQQQFAKEIAESEAAIKMVEKGILPEDDHKLINKIENYLGIRILKERDSQRVSYSIQKEPVYIDEKEGIDFDPITTKTLTIEDLRNVENKKETEILGEFEGGEEVENIEEVEKRDVSQEEIDRIIFDN